MKLRITIHSEAFELNDGFDKDYVLRAIQEAIADGSDFLPCLLQEAFLVEVEEG